jgi:hypothetical protein
VAIGEKQVVGGVEPRERRADQHGLGGIIDPGQHAVDQRDRNGQDFAGTLEHPPGFIVVSPTIQVGFLRSPRPPVIIMIARLRRLGCPQ